MSSMRCQSKLSNLQSVSGDCVVLQGGAEGHHSELMDTYIKEQKRDDAERDPEM